MLIIVPRFLNPENAYLDIANILLGMILMVIINSLITGIRSRDKNYLYLAMFFAGTIINAISNLYIQFIIPTIEPYIGSWISMLAFILFTDNYLSLPANKNRIFSLLTLTTVCVTFFCLSIIHHIFDPDNDSTLISVMDVFTAGIILMLLIFLITQKIRGRKKAGSLLLFESFMILGSVAALGIFKNAVMQTGIIPMQVLQGNFLFLIGMTINGLLFSYILSGEMIELKVQSALTEIKNQELQNIDRAKNNFMMNISHELRTPVTIISGVIGQLKQGRWGDSITGAKKQLETIERNNLRLMKQISNLLELSKMEQLNHKIIIRKINISSILNIIVLEFQSLIEQHQQNLTVDLPDNTEIFADPHLLETAVLNLLTNAVKFTPPGGDINISVQLQQDNTRIIVSDTGPGIAEDQQDLIFERFQQADNEEHSSWRGTGIGLAMVKQIMKCHNGAAGVDSKPGKGSCFYLDFPVSQISASAIKADNEESKLNTLCLSYKAELESDSTQSAEEDINEDLQSSENPTILIVEDNCDLMKYIITELSFHFQITSSENGIKALKQLETVTPDLIISDIMMPEMDGYQLHNEIKKNEKLAAIPFLFLTARDSIDEKVKALEQGVVDYIKKPFSAEELSAKIKSIISSNRAGKMVYQKQLKESLIDFIENFQDENMETVESSFSSLCAEKELTLREQDVARLIRKGLSDKEIASILELSVKTVGNYNTSIFRKLNVSGRLELMTVGR